MRWKIVLAVCAAVTVLGLAVASQSTARGGFDERSVRGVWGFSATGQILPPAAPQATPFTAINRIVFDGAGNCEVVALVNVGGNLVGPLVAESCEYSVDQDGFGRSVAQFGPDSPVTAPLPIAFVIVDNARELRIINTAVLIGEGTAKRM